MRIDALWLKEYKKSRKLASGQILNVYIKCGYDPDDEGFNKVMDGFTWEIESATAEGLEIQLLFKNPNWVSKGDIPDQVNIHFIRSEMFRSQRDN